ncbi:hypothetical protein GOODEAATRI_013864 [Goodea atripinnis]|uniref:Uncharacterized protein n=1 Tax=Goodea atripinnis TaxID=208336 RepID=A0ABV0PE20_9TELE
MQRESISTPRSIALFPRATGGERTAMLMLTLELQSYNSQRLNWRKKEKWREGSGTVQFFASRRDTNIHHLAAPIVMHVEKPECDRGERRREPVQRQNTTWGTGIITRPTEATLFVLLNKMEACDLWTASICLEQGETQIHVCYYGLSM